MLIAIPHNSLKTTDVSAATAKLSKPAACILTAFRQEIANSYLAMYHAEAFWRNDLEDKVCDVAAGVFRAWSDAQSGCWSWDWTRPHCCPHASLPCFGSPGKATR